ncbi:MAG TPA: type II toxin-antitoxin system ParD family antitoxin [Thermomicrobiales bacterium]|nr:type II toxin-antitoxin system ParD family antitoxin [Thermomicrobiales bacterium]
MIGCNEGASRERQPGPQLEEIVRKKVESGMYGSASEVIREAIRLMDHQADIAEADAEFERGEYFVESPAFWASVQEEAERMEREGIEPAPKVRP